MSNRFHNKFHRQNHHSKRTTKNNSFNDSSYDPIASFEEPFQGEFFSEGDILTTENLSAQKGIFSENASIANDLSVQNNAQIAGTLTVAGNSFLNSNLTVQQNLSVAGNSTIDGNLILSGNLTVLGSAVELDTTVVAGSALTITNYGTGPALTINQYGNEPIAHFIDINGDDIIFQDNGYVGLGTDSPNEKLTVVGNISSVGDLIVTGSVYVTGSNVIEGNLEVDTDVLFADVTNNLVGINTNTPNVELTIVGSASATGNLTIDSDTVLGSLSSLNTTTINGSLSVISNKEDAALTVFQEGTGNSVFVTSSAQTPFVVDSTGRVGIATGSPNEALTIVGNVSSTGNVYIDSNTYIQQNLTVSENISSTGTVTISSIFTGLTNSVITKDDNNTLETREINSRVWDTTSNLLTGALTQNYLSKFDNDSTLVDSNVYSDGTNVGINTSSPNEALTVIGNLSSTGDLYIGGAEFVAGSLTLSQNISSSGTATFGSIPSDTTNDVIIKDANNTLKTQEINSRVWDTSANFLSGALTQNYLPKFDSNSSLVNSIIYDNGVFVGINTSSPTDTFTVHGSSKFFGNVTIFGDLTASGTSTFANTVFATTSSLSVVHIGSGPAAWIGNDGTGDIASFYDIDAGVEVLHVGGINGDNPNVGVKTSTPNVDFTVNGEISASENLYVAGSAIIGTLSNGSTNTVVIHDINNILQTRTINSKIWDTTANFLSGALTQNYLPKFDTGSSVTDSNIYSDGTNVGIGTSNPNKKLTVVGQISSTESLYALNGTFVEEITSNGAVILNQLNMSNNLIVNALNPISAQDVVTKSYADSLSATLQTNLDNVESALTNSLTSVSAYAESQFTNINTELDSVSSYTEYQFSEVNTELDGVSAFAAFQLSSLDTKVDEISSYAEYQFTNINTELDEVSAFAAFQLSSLNVEIDGLSSYSDVQFLAVNTELDQVSAYTETQFGDIHAFVRSSFLPLTGGNLTGDVTVVGSITAFESIIALSGLEVGGGTSVSMFVNGGKIGINTDTPNEALTVVGSVSATSVFYGDGSGLTNTDDLNVNTVVQSTSSSWNNVYTTVQVNSATVWSYQGTDLKDLSANWQSTFNTVNALSTSWEETAEIIPTVTNYLSTNNVLLSSLTILDTLSVSGGFNAGTGVGTSVLFVGATNSVGINTEIPNEALTVVGNVSATGIFYGDGSGLINTDNLEVNTIVQNASADWNSVYSTVQTNSATVWNYQGTDLKALSSNWESTYTTFTNASSSFVQTDTTNSTPGLSAITRLVAVSALPLVQEVGTLYVLI